MKIKSNHLLTLLLLTTFAFSNVVPVPIKSATILWKGYKVTGEHFGTIDLATGSLEFEDDQLVGGQFEVNMTTITVTDLSGKSKKSLEGHLKSDDFFGVEQFPTATMVITSVEKNDTGYSVTGDFTIKGATHPVIFPMTVEENSANAEVKIDRSKYNVRYGSNSFFDNLGNKAIYDEFDLEITLKF